MPRLYPKQHAAVFDPHRYSVIEASTKAGKTVGCLTWILSRAWQNGKPGHNRWWVAPTFSVSKIAYRRMKRMMIRADPQKTVWDSNESELFISFINQSSVWFKGADKPDSLYGEDVFDAVIDEGSRIKEEAWHAVRSTLTATKGSIRIIGNVKGRLNWAYQMGQKAKAGDEAMGYHKLTAYDAVEGGVLDIQEVEDAKRMLPEQVFRELYLAEPSDDGGNPFGLSAIAQCIKPLSTNPVACWGVDLAKSQDWVVAIGVDVYGDVVVSQRWQAPWNVTTERLVILLKDKPSLVDSTGVGDPIVEALQGRLPMVEGYKFTQQSKQQLMEGLAHAVQQRECGFPDGWLRNEMDSFGYEYTRIGVRYSAPEGSHDDGVCALALAIRKLRMRGDCLEFSVMIPATAKRVDTVLTMDRGWN